MEVMDRLNRFVEWKSHIRKSENQRERTQDRRNVSNERRRFLLENTDENINWRRYRLKKLEEREPEAIGWERAERTYRCVGNDVGRVRLPG